MKKRSLSADRKAFRKAAQERWERLYPGQEWGECECGCGVWLHKDTAPHHLDDAAGGLGGNRVHDPERMRFLTYQCHEDVEHHRKEIE